MSQESLLTKIPENLSFLQTTKFLFSFPNLPFARYFCQTVNFPGISTSEVMVPTPFSDTYRHGDKLVFEPLVVTALMDEDMRVWEETYNWLNSLTTPAKFQDYIKNKLNGNPYSDAVLTINTNANINNLRVKFLHCHPVSLSSIQFNTSDTADITPICDVTFRYDRFIFERI